MAAALLALLLTACDDSAEPSNEAAQTPPASPPRVTVVAQDYSYEMPAEIPAGAVTLTLRNEGPEPHHAQLARLNDGVTLAQFTAELQRGPEAILPLLSFPGGPAVVTAGASQEVTLNLDAGQYVMLCFVESPDGLPHVAKGMIQPFRVVDAGPGTQPAPADGEVTLRDFGFTMPSRVRAGAELKVTNAGPQPHEMNVVKPVAGNGVTEILAYLDRPEGAPPFTPMGGMNGLSVQSSGWMPLDLAPGAYMAICLIPDPASGKSHAQLGMIQPFTVE